MAISYLSWILNWFRNLLFSKELEVALVGLQAAGKTSLVNVLGNGQFSSDVVPTIAFNLRRVTKGNVTLKIWDVAGQPKFRNMWERYCRGVQAIVYVVDAADLESIPSASHELQSLLSIPELKGIPLLVLGNKNDLPTALSVEDLIAQLKLAKVTGRPVSCYSTSMKTNHNIDIVLAWLAQRAH
ncbi:P-loop containing nucleoside triphosphate hydrolase protein [Mrakia frigida]|uniref:ADP-ribosylation factor-like protein n=1 Tax=Mrakia frigida TaxID=29902 RepID=UPI003FCC027E